MARRRGCPPPCQISPYQRNDRGIGPPKLKFSLRFNQNVDFHNICRVCTSFQDALYVKILLDFLEGLWSYGGLRGLVTPKFSALPRGETILEVQERAGSSLSPCQVWWGLGFHPPPGAAKNIEFFCLSVSLSVHHAFERQSLCTRFRHEGLGVQKRC